MRNRWLWIGAVLVAVGVAYWYHKRTAAKLEMQPQPIVPPSGKGIELSL